MTLPRRSRTQIIEAVRQARAEGVADPLVSLMDVVTLTQFHERTLRRYVEEATLPVERLGPTRRIYFRWSVVKKNWPEDTQRI